MTFEAYYPPFESWYEVRANPVGGELFVYFTNINLRKRLESYAAEQTEALEQTETRLSLLVQQTPLGVIEWDVQGKIVSWNPSAERIFGYSAEEAIASSLLELVVPPALQGDVQIIMDALLQQKGGTRSTNENITKDGRYIMCDWYNAPLINEEGEVLGGASVVWDVSVRVEIEQARQTLAAVVSHSKDFIGVVDLDGVTTYLNPTGRKMIHLPAETNLKTQTLFDYIPSEYHDFLQQEIIPVVFKTGAWRGEFYLRNLSDDSQIPVDFNLFLVKDPETEEPLCFATVTRDISERKQAEKELQATQNFLASILEALPVGVIAKEAQDLRFVLWNKAATELLGHPAEAVLGKNDYDLFTPEQAAFFIQKDREVLNQGQVLDIPEEEVFRGDGETRILHTQKTAVFSPEGLPQYLLAITEDITERKQAENLLKASEERLNSILSSLQDIVWSASSTTYELLYLNPVSEKVYGRSLEEFYGNPNLWFEVIHPDDQAKMTVSSQVLLEKGFRELEYRIVRPDGEVRWLLDRAYLIYDESGQSVRMDGITRDITEQKLAEQQLRESEQRYQVLAETAPISVVYMDSQYNCLYVNYHWSSLTGLDLGDSLEQGWLQVFDRQDRDRVLKKWQQSQDAAFRTECRIRDCTQATRWVIYQAKAILGEEGAFAGYVATLTDITDRKYAEREIKQKAQELEKALRTLQQTQTQLIQSEKMSSLGQLVAGIAHEINNPVNFIYGNLDHIKEYTADLQEIVEAYQQHYPDPKPEIQDLLEDLDLEFLLEDLPKTLHSIQVGATRIRSIVASLRTFSRLDEAECKDVDIHEGIESTLMILQSRTKSKPDHPGIEIIKNYGEIPPVQCYAGQLNQVFMNILVNALDALEERDKNRSYSEISAQPSQIFITTKIAKNQHIEIQIKDNGLGIPEEVKSRIFDPFFTTKSIGKGTGLGMSISYQIITERHKGTLKCISELGKGAEFIITIPLHQNLS